MTPLADLSISERWPLPEQVGRWGSAAEFSRQRAEAGQWVFWRDRFDLVLAGRYHEVIPLHVELSPTFLCNFACPWCSCRSAREERSRTLVGVSIVVDSSNVNDILPTARFLSGLCTGERDGRIDYVIMRPAFPIVGAQVDVDHATVDAFLREAAPDSQARRLLDDAGIEVVVPDASVSVVDAMPDDDLGCVAAGWFGEVTPSGDMLPCSDLYGDPGFYIGNIANDSLTDIWKSDRRRTVLGQVRRERCPSNRCPANGRGHHLNRAFRQVETFRRSGRLNEVARWAEDLRRVLPVPEHSFFL
ncbi:MAG: SPASM domain-containing protein [Pseudonocardiaceae bacterium]